MIIKSEKREAQSFKKRYGPRKHKVLGINKWVRINKERKKDNPELQSLWIHDADK